MKLRQLIHYLEWVVFVVQLTPCDTQSYQQRHPTNADDVASIVVEAIGLRVKVKAFGIRHSQTDIIDSEGISIDTGGLKSSQMNSDNTATFGPGVTVEEACKFLLENGRALQAIPAFRDITLGGAIGTGAHGSTLKYNSTISALVRRMTVVNGLGQIVEIFTSDDLKAFSVHLGLLGIVVSITLDTVPLFKVEARNFVVSEDVLTDGTALNWAKNSDHITFNWFPSLKRVVVANLTFVSADTEGDDYTNAVSPPTYGKFNFYGGGAKEVAYSLSASNCAAASGVGNKIAHAFEIGSESSLLKSTPGYVPIYTEGYTFNRILKLKYDKPHTVVLYLLPLTQHQELNELVQRFCIGTSNLTAFVAATKDVMTKTPLTFPLSGILLRFSRNSDAYMSTSYGRDTVNVEFSKWKRRDMYNDPSGSLAGFQLLQQILTKTFNGRSHWGKSGPIYHGSEMLDLKLDPFARGQFIAAMKKFDPNGTFANNFGRCILRNGTKIRTDPLTTRCALLDNCFCSKNSDCACTQTCGTLPGYPNYPVCKTMNEIPEKQLNEDEFPPPAGIFDWLKVDVPKLLVSTLAQCSPIGLIDTTTCTVENFNSILGGR